MKWSRNNWLEHTKWHDMHNFSWFFRTTPFSDWEFDNSLSLPELVHAMFRMIHELYETFMNLVENASNPTYEEIENDMFIHWYDTGDCSENCNCKED